MSFGELALMYNAPRAATVKASSQSKVWALDRATFKVTHFFAMAGLITASDIRALLGYYDGNNH
jgi:CRP-like cAMP-binding protein